MQRMPALFVGHGSPMNAIEENEYTRAWEALAQGLPRPEAILCVSAHWFTRGTRVSALAENRMIYDMYGFPDELYRVVYPAPGAPAVARRALALLGGAARQDDTWGLDHGAWSVLRRMYPQADVPVFQVSVDMDATPETHFALGKALAPLRNEGVMILASGNVVHNLGMVAWGQAGGFPWADTFDRYVREAVTGRAYGRAVAFREAGPSARLAVPTPDHYAPLLYALGAAAQDDALTVFCDARMMGSLSMTGYAFTQPQSEKES